MENINNKFLAQMILGSAILRFPMHKNGIRIIGGAVLVFDSIQKLHSTLDVLEESGTACRCENLNGIESKPSNYQLGIHIYRKGELEDVLLKYLENTDFFPVIFVNEIVPEFFAGYGYIFRQNNAFTMEDRLLCDRFKEWVINHIEIVVEEIRRAKSSGKIPDGVDDFYELYIFGLSVSQVWKGYYLSEGVSEDVANEWQEDFLIWLLKSLRDKERFVGLYQITEAFNNLFFKYIAENECFVLELEALDEDVYSFMKEDKVILFDEESYWIPESLLAKICKPLTAVVSYNQIKAELAEEGTLMCNGGKKRNYTVKKLFTIGADRKIIRPRLVRIVKDALHDENNLTVEQYTGRKMGVM